MPRADLRHKRCAIYTRKSSEEGLTDIRTGRIEIVVVYH